MKIMTTTTTMITICTKLADGGDSDYVKLKMIPFLFCLIRSLLCGQWAVVQRDGERDGLWRAVSGLG
jgi:hypothetical protein